MIRVATIVENGRVVGLVHGSDACDQSIVVNGRTWRFDFDEMFGPLWLKADGSERKNQNVPEEVWLVWAEWQKRWNEEKTKAPNDLSLATGDVSPSQKGNP